MLAATLVAALALYFAVGHVAHMPMAAGAMGDGMHGVGTCLLVVALLAPLVLAPPTRSPMPRASGLVIPRAVSVPRAVPFRARASPAWLQRFLN